MFSCSRVCSCQQVSQTVKMFCLGAEDAGSKDQAAGSKDTASASARTSRLQRSMTRLFDTAFLEKYRLGAGLVPTKVLFSFVIDFLVCAVLSDDLLPLLA